LSYSGFHALFSKQVHDGIDQRLEYRIGHRFGDCQVEIQIGFNLGFPAIAA
jgi:hypothetical protein